MVTKKIILFLLSFYGAALLGCEESSIPSSNYATRISAIVQNHKSKMASTPLILKFYDSSTRAKKISVKIEDFPDIERGLQELEQYDWENAQRKDATELMKKGMAFALKLNQLNSFFFSEQQYRQDDQLITIFKDDPLCNFNSVKNAYSSALAGGNENAIKGLEFFD